MAVAACADGNSPVSHDGEVMAVADLEAKTEDILTDLVRLPDLGPAEISDHLRRAESLEDLSEQEADYQGDVGADLALEPKPDPDYSPTGFVGTDGSFFRDEIGRVLMLRGVNVSNGSKGAPFYPAWLQPEHYQMISAGGFNVIRFLLQWEAVEPEPGIYDEQYLDLVEQRVGLAQAAGLYVLLDMHQDVWGQKYGGNGAPEWATIDHGLPFDPPAGVNWFMKYGEPAVCQAFQSLWDNEEGIRDNYANAWQTVAARFADNHAVIGFDLMNEPWVGNYSVMEIPEFESQALVPFYAAVAEAIRAVDSNHIIFVEPSATRSIGMLGGMGPIGDDLVAYAPHYYHPTMDMMGRYWDSIDSIDALFTQFRSEAQAVGGPVFLGEFGFFAGNEGDNLYARHQIELFEKYSMSFAAWSFDPGNGGFNMLNKDLQPTWPLELLSTPYPERVNGDLVTWHFHRGYRELNVEVSPAGWPPGKTVIALPDKMYPDGLLVHCETENGTPCQADYDQESDAVSVDLDADSVQSFTLRIRPAGNHPMPVPGLSTHIKLGNAPAQSQELKLEHEAGVQMIRTDFHWHKIEPQDGQFLFDPYQALVDNAAPYEIDVLALLVYSVKWARSDPDDYGTIDESQFAQFAGTVASQLSGKVDTYEIWNEPDLATFFKPEPNPAKYGKLLKVAYSAIKEQQPDATVLFGGHNSIEAFAGMPWDFFRRAMRAHPDLGNYFDGLAIHPYTFLQTLAPEQENPGATYVDLLTSARQVLGDYGLATKPLYLTETGWPACPCPPLEPPVLIPNVTYDQQALYLARSFILSWVHGVHTYLWYDFIDSAAPGEIFSEAFFGLFQYDPDPSDETPPDPKPAYQALSTLTATLGGLVLDRVEPTAPHCHHIVFSGDGQEIHVVWNSGEDVCDFQLPLAAGETGKVKNLVGNPLPDVAGPEPTLAVAPTQTPDSFMYVEVVTP